MDGWRWRVVWMNVMDWNCCCWVHRRYRFRSRDHCCWAVSRSRDGYCVGEVVAFVVALANIAMDGFVYNND